jgi:DNA-binding CsgD family transcriptional regulator
MMLATKNQLTRLEREVLCLLAIGHTDRKIAELLTISPCTVNRHGRFAGASPTVRHHYHL